MNPYKTIDVDFSENEYQIYVGHGVIEQLSKRLLEKTKNNKVIIVGDSFFKDTLIKKIAAELKKEGFIVHSYLMDAGKGNKNINEVLKIYSILEENNFARDSSLIAVGGGVIGDLAGFVASTWLRGMQLVHIPTTLMAMVDSSVGGKVAINFRQTINAIGNYYHPIFTLMDLEFVDTLSERDYRSGLAEVIKCAIINDKEFYKYLETNVDKISDREHNHVIDFIVKTVNIKIAHVKGDVRESNKRLLLNYGHTLGHAVEISTQKNHQELYRHGEGVSIGIMAAAYIATQYLNIPQNIYDSYENLFKAYSLPTYVDIKETGQTKKKLLQKCIKNVNKDKKRINNYLRVILADEIGKASIYTDVPFEIIEKAFDHIIRD